MPSGVEFGRAQGAAVFSASPVHGGGCLERVARGSARSENSRSDWLTSEPRRPRARTPVPELAVRPIFHGLGVCQRMRGEAFRAA